MTHFPLTVVTFAFQFVFLSPVNHVQRAGHWEALSPHDLAKDAFCKIWKKKQLLHVVFKMWKQYEYECSWLHLHAGALKVDAFQNFVQRPCPVCQNKEGEAEISTFTRVLSFHHCQLVLEAIKTCIYCRIIWVNVDLIHSHCRWKPDVSGFFSDQWKRVWRRHNHPHVNSFWWF